MECEENGAIDTTLAGHRGVKRKRGGGGAGCVQLARAPALPGAPGAAPRPGLASPPTVPRSPVYRSPFLNVKLMEEITFWVCTRRAPCLYGYNNVYKKKIEEAHCSKYRNSSEPSSVEEVPSPKKKRKLRLLDDETVSTEKQQNIYFEQSHKQHRRSWYSSDKSESDRSDVDFNIKNSFSQNKSKAFKTQRRNRSTPNKKNKIVTSTPKATALRRSLRKPQQNLHSSQNDCSLVIFNADVVNGDHRPSKGENSAEKNKLGNNHHSTNSKVKGEMVLKEQSKNEMVPNGQFEDMSDVSGFTANYIRSTKIDSKTPQKVRSKRSRNLARQSQQKLHKDESKIIVCVNKSVNTGLQNPGLNQSTDSSQNVINLVTVNNNNNEKSLKIDQSTSQLKFMDSKNEQIKDGDKDETQNVNVSFQSRSSGISRYPTRHRSNSKVAGLNLENSASGKKRASRGMRELRSINQNEQPICLVSRTRSGKPIGVMDVDLNDSGCSKGQVNDVADQLTPSVVKHVSGSAAECVGKKQRVPSARCTSRSKKLDNRKQRSRKDSDVDSVKKNDSDSSSSQVKCSGSRVADKRQSLRKESLRDRSGFAACFSDSDEDKPLLRRKFFC